MMTPVALMTRPERGGERRTRGARRRRATIARRADPGARQPPRPRPEPRARTSAAAARSASTTASRPVARRRARATPGRCRSCSIDGMRARGRSWRLPARRAGQDTIRVWRLASALRPHRHPSMNRPAIRSRPRCPRRSRYSRRTAARALLALRRAARAADAEELAALDPDLHAALFGAPPRPFSLTLVFPRFDGARLRDGALAMARGVGRVPRDRRGRRVPAPRALLPVATPLRCATCSRSSGASTPARCYGRPARALRARALAAARLVPAARAPTCLSPVELERDLQRARGRAAAARGASTTCSSPAGCRGRRGRRARASSSSSSASTGPTSRTTRDRFRFQTLQSRYAAFVDLWDRGLRAREEAARDRSRRADGSRPPRPGADAAADGSCTSPRSAIRRARCEKLAASCTARWSRRGGRSATRPCRSTVRRAREDQVTQLQETGSPKWRSAWR